MSDQPLTRDYGSRMWYLVEYSVPFILLLVMPVILPFARRAGPLVFSVAALFAAICIWRRGELKSRFLRMDALVLSLVCFFAWSALTLAWSPWVERGLLSFLTGVEIFIAALIIMALPPKLSHARMYFLMAAGLAFASIVIFADLRFGAPLLKLLNARPDPFRYNMVLVSLLPLSVAVVPVTLRTPWLIFRVISLLIFAAAAFSSESETAKVTLILLVGVFSATLALPKKFVWLMMLLIVMSAWVSAPWLSHMMVYGKTLLGSFWETGHASERISIWAGFGEMALAGLPWGWGIDASPAAQLTPFFSQASVETQRNVSWLHPHSMPLQVYVELGLPGVFLGGLVSLLALPGVNDFTKPIWPQCCALVAVVFTVSIISHGFWQTWWWVAIVIGLYALRAIRTEDGA